ncbi:MAG: NAD-dependent epimerase/dehydratase family protein [Sandaracinaceae bacterium]|nr:NAD-dependent epimerase/dehydratase family protein [Sandaracinaceae bacterium]
MKILVLGATGFIGRAAVRHLADAGEDVRGLARSEGGRRELEAMGVEARGGSLGDPQSIADAARGVDVVVNAAGIASPRAAPRALRWTHVAGTENVLNAATHAGVRRVVHVSCADATLANVDRVHWDEKKNLAHPPFGERARTLLLAEEIAQAAGSPELERVVLRGTWVWGPGDTSRLPGLCREALAHGGLHLCGDGRSLIATTYVDHLAEAVVAAVRNETAAGGLFYVADPEFLEAREFFRMLSDACGLPPPRTGPRWWALSSARLGRGPAGLCADEVLQRARSTLFDINEAIGKLGARPEIGVEDGMKSLAAWVEARGGAKAIAALYRPPVQAGDVDAQVAAAGGD